MKLMNILPKYFIRKQGKEGIGVTGPGIIFGLLFLLALLILASLLAGPAGLQPARLLSALTHPDPSTPEYQILYSIRLPRTAATILAGISLAMSGAILQTLLNNSLAGPNIIGVNAGAGFSTMLILAFFPQYFYLIPLAAFAGAIASAVFIFWLAFRTGVSRLTIILAGVACASFLSAATDTVLVLSPDKTLGVTTFMIGGFAGVTFRSISPAFPYMLAAMLLALILSRSLSLLSLGDDMARSLGLKVGLHRFLLILCAAVLAGGAVSFAGLLGFVGLIIPHVTRILIGTRQKYYLIISALLGGCFVTFCDWLARLIFKPYELPVGIIMAFLGAPFFIWLLLKKKRGRIYD